MTRFGTFHGVFRPTILTILGALLYLREGWVIGHAGLGGFVIILAACYLVTATTALSMASITTNIRIGHGGAFSIIAQSMGLEAGGAIAVPFYLTQALSGAFYLYAFAEGWCYLFPDHPVGWVAFGTFLVVVALAFVGARYAFKVQGLVFYGILAALVSAAVGLRDTPPDHPIAFWSSGTGPSLVELFALFFPAATGVLVGASMSGSLENARRSIPRGTLFAVGISFAVYLLMGVWYAVVATGEELRGDYLIMVRKAAWGPAVLVGLLSSTFSASISTFVAAPRTLQALGRYGIVPSGDRMAAEAPNGEPRNAMLVTTVVVGLGLLAGGLNAIAPLLTVVFLITYASINLVLLVEQSLGLPSFRPTFAVPRVVPLAGFVASVLAILATSPVVGLMALSVVIGLYFALVGRRLETPFETVRSGLFVNIAAWAARRIASLPTSTERTWKPDLMVPVEDTAELAGMYRLLRALVGPSGSVKIIGTETPEHPLDRDDLARLVRDLESDEIYATSTTVQVASYGVGVVTSMAILRGAFFPPNVVFASLNGRSEADLQRIVDAARAEQVGVALLSLHERAALGRERVVNVWIRDQSPDWRPSLQMASLDLALLLALQVVQRYGELHLTCVVDSDAKVEPASRFLAELRDEARIPGRTREHVVVGKFGEYLERAPQADLDIIGLADTIHVDWMHEVTRKTRSSVLFVRASGKESALA